MSEERPDAEIVAQKWDGTFKSQVEAPIPRFSWSHPAVNAFLQENYFRAPSVTKVLADLLGDQKVTRGLEIGGGLGQQAINCYKMLGAERFDVLDLSSYAVEHGNQSARENGLNIHYSVADLNTDTLPADTYDLIIANGSMHHIKNLEHIFEQINRALRPGGALFINEYVGPNYVQWTEKQLGIMNQLAAVLPDRLNRFRERNDAVVREITRIPLDIFAKHDPSESVRSSEILPMMHRYMDVVEVRPFGHTILYELLRGRIHNYDQKSEADDTILRLLCVFEKVLIDEGVLPSDFCLAFARPRR
jgi:SAM-dependent methyltransferase